MSENELLICIDIKKTISYDISIDEVYNYYKDTFGFKRELIILDMMDFKAEVMKELQALAFQIVISVIIALFITMIFYYYFNCVGV